VDVLHHDLEAVEAACLWDLNLTAETLDKVLVDNAIRCSEESKDVRDEEALVVVETLVPIMKILGQINLFCSPERCFGLLVHVPDLVKVLDPSFIQFTRLKRVSRLVAYLVILDGKENESLRVLLENRLIPLLLPQSGCRGDFF